MIQASEAFTPEEIIIPPRLRTGINEDSVCALMQSIKHIGLRTPLTVRWDKDDEGVTIVLVAGRHRLEAYKRLGMQLVDCIVFKGTETEARLWEIAENLHRADLTELERAEHLDEWRKLMIAKVAQVAPPSGKQPSDRGHRATAREFGTTRRAVERAEKIASIAPEARAEATGTPIADNQAALLRVASEPSPAAQLAAIKREKDAAEAHRRNRQSDRIIALTEAEQFASWLMERTDLNEMPTIISWLEGCKPRDVIAALRREAA